MVFQVSARPAQQQVASHVSPRIGKVMFPHDQIIHDPLRSPTNCAHDNLINGEIHGNKLGLKWMEMAVICLTEEKHIDFSGIARSHKLRLWSS